LTGSFKQGDSSARRREALRMPMRFWSQKKLGILRLMQLPCIGCGACVASCPNAAAMLFTSAKLTHLNSLPQGQPQRDQRTLAMVVAMMNENFGSCNGECEAVCPKEIPLEFIGKMNRDLIQAIWRRHREPALCSNHPMRMPGSKRGVLTSRRDQFCLTNHLA
jgi:ferredoxin